MSVVELIHRRDHRVRLVWEQRCDCAPHDRPLVAAVYLHEGIRYLYVPAVKGPHVRTGARVKQRGRARQLGGILAEVSQCSRCRSYFALSSSPVPTGFLAIAFDTGEEPDHETWQEGDRAVIVEVKAGEVPVRVMSELLLTRLGPPTHGVTAAAD